MKCKAIALTFLTLGCAGSEFAETCTADIDCAGGYVCREDLCLPFDVVAPPVQSEGCELDRGRLIAESQRELDAFACEPGTVYGDLELGDVDDLEPLRNVTRIVGEVVIVSDTLTSLAGLRSLEEVTRGLHINAPLVDSLAPLAALQSAGYLSFSDMAIRDLEGLAGLEHARSLALYRTSAESLAGLHPNAAIEFISLVDNVQLTDASVLDSIAIDDTVFITNSPGLEALTLNLGDTLQYLYLRDLTSLRQLSIRGAPTEVTNFQIANVPITDIEFARSVRHVETLELSGLTELLSVEPLCLLDRSPVASYSRIQNNPHISVEAARCVLERFYPSDFEVEAHLYTPNADTPGVCPCQ